METKTALFCLGPAAKGALEVRQVSRRNPAADEVEIAMEAASVNPDRRAARRGLWRAALVADWRRQVSDGARQRFCRHRRDNGAKVSALKPGERVYGLKPTSADGTHASHVLVKAAYVLHAPADGDLQALAALPYSFVTMWLAVRGAGLTRVNAAGKKVLVHGAGGRTRHIGAADVVPMGRQDHRHRPAADARGCLQAGAAEVARWQRDPFSQLGRVRSMQHSISPLGTMTLRSSAACGTARSAMPRPCIHCWAISTNMAGCAVAPAHCPKRKVIALPCRKARKITHGRFFGPMRRRYRTSRNLSNSSVSAFPSASANPCARRSKHSITSGKGGPGERC